MVGYGLGPLGLFVGVDKPVAKSHDQGAAHDIAERGDRKVERQPGGVEGIGAGDIGSIAAGVHQNAHGQKVHVGNAVFKTAGHKGCNGQQNTHDFIDHGLAGGTDPYGQAHKDVAQNAAEEDGDGVDRNLTGGDAHHGIGDALAVELVNGCHVNQKDNEQGADKIADPHNSPSFEHLDERDLFALKRADHKRVAGKQLRAANEHEHQSQAKSKTAHEALSAPAKRGIAQKDGEEQTAESDERTGEHGEQKGLRDRQIGLGNAGSLGLGLDRGGCKAIGGGIFCLALRHGNHYFLTMWDKRCS